MNIDRSNMLERIEPQAAELGMFIERFEGSWLTHPFWKRRFLLADAAKLEALRSSSVKGVIIDTSKGKAPTRDVLPSTRARTAGSCGSTSQVTPKVTLAAPAPCPTPLPPYRSAQASTTARQFGDAKRIAANSGKMVSRIFLKARLGEAISVKDIQPVIDDVHDSIASNPHILNAVLRCQQGAVETYRHALAVCSLMIALGRALRLSPDQTKMAGLVGLLMDVGVVQLQEHLSVVDGDYRGLPQDFLDQHVFYGHDILAKLRDIPAECLHACLHHHERIDGSGYPGHIHNQEIGQLARMAAICDEFDYLVCGGFNSDPIDPHAAIENLFSRENEFDGNLLQVFQQSTGLYPIGTFVEMRSGCLAMVVDLDRDDADAPIVRTFNSWRNRSKFQHMTVNLATSYGSDGIVRVARPIGLSGPELKRLRARLLNAAHRG